jgi:hypothetical protein
LYINHDGTYQQSSDIFKHTLANGMGQDVDINNDGLSDVVEMDVIRKIIIGRNC